jgi:hypothetical protein
MFDELCCIRISFPFLTPLPSPHVAGIATFPSTFGISSLVRKVKGKVVPALN